MGQEFTSCFLDVRKPRKMLNFGQELKFKQTSSESNKISFIDPYDHGESLKKIWPWWIKVWFHHQFRGIFDER
jgi:hypothetical protein